MWPLTSGGLFPLLYAVLAGHHPAAQVRPVRPGMATPSPALGANHARPKGRHGHAISVAVHVEHCRVLASMTRRGDAPRLLACYRASFRAMGRLNRSGSIELVEAIFHFIEVSSDLVNKLCRAVREQYQELHSLEILFLSRRCVT